MQEITFDEILPASMRWHLTDHMRWIIWNVRGIEYATCFHLDVSAGHIQRVLEMGILCFYRWNGTRTMQINPATGKRWRAKFYVNAHSYRTLKYHGY